MTERNRVIIIGSGPAGLTAAIYTARANMDTTVIAGNISGGQLMITTDVENFPGFAEGIMGPELMEQMIKQTERFGTKMVYADATKVEFNANRGVHKVYVDNDVYEADAVIIATGASAMWLGLEDEQRLMGRGVSGCATCDGFFFKGKEIAVVGGGDSAIEEANFLTKFGTKVTLIHRRDKFRASKIMQDRAMNNPKIEMMLNTEVEKILGDDKVEGLRLKDANSGEIREIKADGFFVAIGHRPNTGIFKGWLTMNEQGYIVKKDETETEIPGVFVAGDVYDFRYRQAITAAGSGCKAALDAEKYLEALSAEIEEMAHAS